MKDLAILIPSWKGSDYLPACLKSIRLNCVTDYDIFVILNEVDDQSLRICREFGTKFIALSQNEGTLAIDYAIPYLADYQYVANLNIDMIVCPYWDSILLSRLEKMQGMGSVSSPAVEYNGGNNGLDTLNDPTLPKFTDPKCTESFSRNYLDGKYNFPDIISQRHPIITTVKAFLKVGGYSDFDRNWFPGYSLDFFFGFKLWKILGFSNLISVGDAPVLHDYSSSMKKLPPNLQKLNCWGYFKFKAGMTIDEFKQKIDFNKVV